ncbi:hypothetical protein GCM10023084_29350 [Streptomyces lacrimifluminis]
MMPAKIAHHSPMYIGATCLGVEESSAGLSVLKMGAEMEFSCAGLFGGLSAEFDVFNWRAHEGYQGRPIAELVPLSAAECIMTA